METEIPNLNYWFSLLLFFVGCLVRLRGVSQFLRIDLPIRSLLLQFYVALGGVSERYEPARRRCRVCQRWLDMPFNWASLYPVEDEPMKRLRRRKS